MLDSSGHTLKQLYRSADNTGHWVQKKYDVSAFSGQTLLIYDLAIDGVDPSREHGAGLQLVRHVRSAALARQDFE